MAEIELTKDNFEEEVLKSDKPVLVDFWADWCGPCKMQGPILKEFAEKHDEYKIGKVNVDDEPALASEYKVMSIPMLCVFKGGKLVNSEVGFHTEAQLDGMMKSV